MTLHLMRGPAGSGKSTFVAQNLPNAVRVNRDSIRTELSGNTEKFRGDNAFEARVTKIEKERAREALIARKDVVIDATNLVDKFAVQWLDMAHDYGHSYEVHVMDVPLNENLKRNAEREVGVPEAVVRKHFAQAQSMGPIAATHPFVDWSPYVAKRNLPPAVGVDMDGTLALLLDGFSPYDPNHYPYDAVNWQIRLVLQRIADDAHIIVFTGRDEAYRRVVAAWLRDNDVPYEFLYMRPEGDRRRDDVIKAELFNHYVRDQFNFWWQFDDRDRVVKMFRARNIPCWQVADGAF